jgi:hypothetical protein
MLRTMRAAVLACGPADALPIHALAGRGQEGSPQGGQPYAQSAS